MWQVENTEQTSGELGFEKWLFLPVGPLVYMTWVLWY